ncbi:hypothetical protein [Lacrimispora saccharolytica]|uniref:4Fe-4S ferredoxin-type domain-containing protein n=1 Tax=Lacrimispora saccharolytica (strain ATCC 35040 / DSM 2544 / NRCC 2533 / WM1) TaxID=610130 RepID=D9R2M4_LACSW|nr:hypothetical protein [Lacrimispora saccharolytica]ADL06648.1 hypothetical protein Closa_4142 [[Clostridium] saccharolyticum WM1]QRV19282.1 hypothetical protein I6K70_17755 [Lacrimispora saccharolytica]
MEIKKITSVSVSTCFSCMHCISVCPAGAGSVDQLKISKLSRALAEEYREEGK